MPHECLLTGKLYSDFDFHFLAHFEPMKPLLTCLAIAVCFQLSPAHSGDADWPQWQGADRDGHAAPQQLLGEWPDGGPKLKWKIDNLGRGYSAVSVVDDNVYTMGARDGDCYAICLSAATGEVKWETRVSTAGSGENYNADWGAGPRSTPTVDGDQVFVLSDVGVLAALDREHGNIIWSKHLVDDLDGEVPKWGYSESPLVDGDRVVVTPGDKNFMVAVDRRTGQPVWSSQGVDAPAQYVSVIRGEIGNWVVLRDSQQARLVRFRRPNG